MALLSLTSFRLHVNEVGDNTNDALYNDFIRFVQPKALAVMGYGSEAEMVTELVRRLEDIEGWAELDIDIPDAQGATPIADGIDDWMAWLASDVLPELDRDQLASISGFIQKVTAAEEACILLCKKAAQEYGKEGQTATFGVSSVSKSGDGHTITTVYLDMKKKFEDILKPYREWI